MRLAKLIILGGIAALGFNPLARLQAQPEQEIARHCAAFKLANGLRFVVMERRGAPLLSCVTHINLGTSDVPAELAGLAALLARTAFQGTESLGSSNPSAEKVALQEEEVAYTEWLQASSRPEKDSAELARASINLAKASTEAQRFQQQEELTRQVVSQGGLPPHAELSADALQLIYNVPPSRAELWFALEATRLKGAVLRDYYQAQAQLALERSYRLELSAPEALTAELLLVAYAGHPYGLPHFGGPATLPVATRTQAASRLTMGLDTSQVVFALAGDISLKEAKQLAEKYFVNLPVQGRFTPNLPTSAEAAGERRFTIEGRAQPLLISAYTTVAATAKDADALRLLAQVLGGGTGSRLYTKLVATGKAAAVQVRYGYPGTQLPALFLIAITPAQGASVEELERSLAQQLEALHKETPTPDEVERARQLAARELLEDFATTEGSAKALAEAHFTLGNYQKLLNRTQALSHIHSADIIRVLDEYCTSVRHTVGIYKEKKAL